MQELNKINNSDEMLQSDTINIREEIEKYLIHWKWFFLGVFLSLVIAFFYLRYSPSQYEAFTTIMIKDNNKSGISAELAAFEDLGIIGGGSANNTDNEIQILKSRNIIGNVVDTLDLTTTYYDEGLIKYSELYKQSPIIIKFLNKNKLFLEKDTSCLLYTSPSPRD